jgi:hypothetical protein
MDYTLLKNVLTFVGNNYPVKLSEEIRFSKTYFLRLEQEGFIKITKIKGKYIALLTDKGFDVVTF